MYGPKTDGRRGAQTAGAVAMALVMLLSMVAIGGAGVAAQSADVSADQTAESLGDSPTVASSHIPDSGSLQSDEYLVDDDYESGEVADDDQLYPNISAAVSNAESGYTVYVAEGTYDESVDIDKRLDLIGAGSGDAAITGNSVVMTITADDVTVDGFTLVGDDGDNVVEVLATSPSMDVKNLEFTNNRLIVGDDASGLFHEAMDQDVPSHDETVIQGNTFTVAQPSSYQNPKTANYFVEIRADGDVPHNISVDDNVFMTPEHKGQDVGQIYRSVLLQANDSEVTNNQLDARANPDLDETAQIWVGAESPSGERTSGNLVANNHVEANWAWYGITANYVGGEDLTVAQNTVMDAQNTGIIVARYDGAVVQNNDANQNHGPGIYVFSSTDVDVLDNNALENQNVGIVMDLVDGALVDGNHIADTGGSVGLYLNDVTDATASYNVIDNNDVGIEVDGDSAMLGIRKNTISNHEDVGLLFTSFDTSVAPEDRPHAWYNDFSEQDDDVRNEVGDRVDVRLNWFGVADTNITDEASVEGDAIYDPFLTVEPYSLSEAEQQPHKTETFAHDLTLEYSTGPVHTVAIPGPADRTVGEVFEDLPSGSAVYAYDASSDSWVQPAPGDSVAPLDAFVVTNLTEDATVVFGYANDGAAAPANADLDEGWNLVGSPEKNNADDAFQGSTATQTQMLHTQKGPADQPAFMNGVDASGDDPAWSHTFGQSTNKCVSPYTGYWVFVDDDDTGSLPSQLFDGVTYTDEIGLLTTDQACNYQSGT